MTVEEPPIDQLLDRLETVLARLAGGGLSAEAMAAAGEEQRRLVEELTARLRAGLAELVPE